MNTKKVIAMCGALLVFVSAAFAQGVKVSGRVVDEGNGPVIGVAVIEKGLNKAVTTDLNGEYEISVSSGESVLVFNCLGYAEQEIAVGGKAIINVILQDSTEFLDEVVVVGYGTIRKSDMTGSSAAIKTDKMSELKVSSFEQAMQGRMAGVVVSSTSGEPGAGVNISVRGQTSINGGNAPLYVIDGVPMSDISSAQEYGGNSALNIMSMINPSDVVSIEVLKDASSTAIYGSRGANGVIMVTTKQGQKGEAKIHLTANNSFSWSDKYYKLATAKQYGEIVNEFYATEKETGISPYVQGAYIGDIYLPSVDMMEYYVGDGTDWQKEIRRTAHSQDYELSISGGNDKTTYFFSGSANLDEGIIKSTDFDRYSIRANVNTSVKKWLDIKFAVNGAMIESSRLTTNPNVSLAGNPEQNGVVYKALLANPVLPLTHTIFKDEISDSVVGAFGKFNPYIDLQNEIFKKKVYNINSNVDFVFKITKDLIFTARGSALYHTDHNARSWNQDTQIAYKIGGKYMDSRSETFKVTNEDFFNYSKRTGGHSINAVLGVSFEKASNESLLYSIQNYTIPLQDFTYYNQLASAMGTESTPVPVVGASDRTLFSSFARAAYSYKDRYLVNATFRVDASSVFAAKRKWAPFPSFGLGWNFTNEKFMAGAKKVLNRGKIRYSYGISGNQAISPYQSLASLNSVFKPGADGKIFNAMEVGTHPENPYLTWETTAQHDLGFDLGFFADKLTLGIDLYKKTTSNLLQTITIPAQTGYTSYIGNMGSIENKGVEIELAAQIFNTRNFFWDINFTFSANRGKVLDLGSNELLTYLSPKFNQYQDWTHKLFVGATLGDLVGFRTDGLLTAEDIANGYPTFRGANREGDIKFVDQNNPETGKPDGVINLDGDSVVLGNANPDAVIGFGSSIGYKGFSLNFMFQAALGQQLLNMNRLYMEFGYIQAGIPSSDYIANRWTESNPAGTYPRIGSNCMAICDRLVEDASYLRLSNITLKYDLHTLFKNFDALKASIFVTGTNLLTITGYSGYDPEASVFGSNMIRAGIDQGVYPRPSSVTVGIDLTF